MIDITKREWAIIYAALLETPTEVILDVLGDTEYSDITEDEVDELLGRSQQKFTRD